MHHRFVTFILGYLISFFSVQAQSSGLKAYAIVDKEGKPVTFEEMATTLEQADVILFGERHNNPIDHWLQLELTRHLSKVKKDHLMLGAEMFETDDQLILNEYLSGTIKEKHFEKESKIWSNYKTDYRPLVEYAKEQKLSFVATNIPRRYANLVATKGIEEMQKLSDEARSLIAPLPLVIDEDDPGYREIREMTIHQEMKMDNFVNAQAIKDATMAHFILSNWKPGYLFLHFNGDFHSKQYGGIYGYLVKNNDQLKVKTISSVEKKSLEELGEFRGRGDFIIITIESMTKTH